MKTVKFSFVFLFVSKDAVSYLGIIGNVEESVFEMHFFRDSRRLQFICFFLDFSSKTPGKSSYSSKNFIDSLNISPRYQAPTLCYACHLLQLPGKFLVEKAKELGIPKGPLYSQLTNGRTVVLPDGRHVSTSIMFCLFLTDIQICI